MSIPYAEVIGDPVAHSLSPIIHRHWLKQLGIDADYRATHVATSDLAAHLAARRRDSDWRGCNVTIPHKQAVLASLDEVDAGATTIGAVNCIHRAAGSLAGRNSDIDGVAAALAGAEISGRKAVLIGAGGAARAAVRYLLDHDIAEIILLVRDPIKAASLATISPERIRAMPLGGCEEALAGASVIVNASPMGMAGASEMPPSLLASVRANAAGAVLFDMVYKPLHTRFLTAGTAGGGQVADGLIMLIGQARAAFPLFFGCPAPVDDEALRDLLTT